MVQLSPVTLVVNVIFFSQLVVVPDAFSGPRSWDGQGHLMTVFLKCDGFGAIEVRFAI